MDKLLILLRFFVGFVLCLAFIKYIVNNTMLQIENQKNRTEVKR